MKPKGAPISWPGLYEAVAYLAPVALWLWLLGVRLDAFHREQSLTALLSGFQLSLMAGMLAFRGRPVDADRSRSALLVAWIGNFLPFFVILDSKDATFGAIPVAIQTLALCISIFAVLSLRTKVSIAPGNRGICRSGAYRFVRHPMYFGAALGQIALLMEFQNPANFAVIAIATASKIRMCLNEERLLRKDPEYLEYCVRVPHRFIPGVL